MTIERFATAQQRPHGTKDKPTKSQKKKKQKKRRRKEKKKKMSILNCLLVWSAAAFGYLPHSPLLIVQSRPINKDDRSISIKAVMELSGMLKMLHLVGRREGDGGDESLISMHRD